MGEPSARFLCWIVSFLAFIIAGIEFVLAWFILVLPVSKGVGILLFLASMSVVFLQFTFSQYIEMKTGELIEFLQGDAGLEPLGTLIWNFAAFTVLNGAYYFLFLMLPVSVVAGGLFATLAAGVSGFISIAVLVITYKLLGVLFNGLLQVSRIKRDFVLADRRPLWLGADDRRSPGLLVEMMEKLFLPGPRIIVPRYMRIVGVESAGGSGASLENHSAGEAVGRPGEDVELAPRAAAFIAGAPGECSDGGPVCQVCGVTIEGGHVRCTRCDTPHHEDCWEFNGNRCSTYGCGCTECVPCGCGP